MDRHEPVGGESGADLIEAAAEPREPEEAGMTRPIGSLLLLGASGDLDGC